MSEKAVHNQTLIQKIEQRLIPHSQIFKNLIQ